VKSQTVHLFVFNSLADWEPGYAIAGLNNPAFQTNPGRYQVKTVAVTTNPVTTIGGVTILPDMTLAELTPKRSAMLILPGGVSWDAGENTEAAHLAATFLASGVPVAAICGATAGLARLGLLDAKQHTSNSLEYLQTTQYQGSALYQQCAAVTDGNLITAGASAPVDFANHIFKRLDVYSAEILSAWYTKNVSANASS
jgi:putative intracellular protease/amidase